VNLSSSVIMVWVALLMLHAEGELVVGGGGGGGGGGATVKIGGLDYCWS
jgi:hypothetical protein